MKNWVPRLRGGFAASKRTIGITRSHRAAYGYVDFNVTVAIWRNSISGPFPLSDKFGQPRCVIPRDSCNASHFGNGDKCMELSMFARYDAKRPTVEIGFESR